VRRGVAIAVSVGVFVVFTKCIGIREDEFQCESAVAHLQNCCPSFSPSSIHCEFIQECENVTRPDLSVDTSKCLRDMDCDTVRSSGACGLRVVNATTTRPRLVGGGTCTTGVVP
jgi:hypothetical protein